MTVLAIVAVVAFLWVTVVQRSPKLEAAIGWPIAIGVVVALIAAVAFLLVLVLTPALIALR